MATRSRTLLFLQYRNTFSRSGRPRTTGPSFDTSEQSGLLGENRPQHAGEVVVELSTLPPRWVDIVEEAEDEMEKIKTKISELEGLQKKNVLPGFEDQSSDELSMERLTDDITALFHSCGKKVKRINAESQQAAGNKQSIVLGKNIQTSLAIKLQELSGSFRKTQSKYLQKLRGREQRNKTMFGSNAGELNDIEDDDLDAVFTDAQMQQLQNNERAITEREREINEIVKSINGLATIFKELQTMVIDQGTILDRIDYNIEQVAVHVESAHEELQKVIFYFHY